MGYFKKYPKRRVLYLNKEQREQLRKKWQARVADFKASGKTTTEWCAEHDLKPNQLRYWLRKYKETNEPLNTQSQWLKVEIDDNQVSSCHDNTLIVRIGKAVIEVKQGYDKKLLSDLVSTLSELC